MIKLFALVLFIPNLLALEIEGPIYPITSYSVTDGDTIKILEMRIGLGLALAEPVSVRIRGINTPEVRGDEREAGLIIKQKVIDWIDEDPIFALYLETDKYGGRFVGDVLKADGRMLSTYLLDKGYAKVYNPDEKKPTFTEVELGEIIKENQNGTKMESPD